MKRLTITAAILFVLALFLAVAWFSALAQADFYISVWTPTAFAVRWNNVPQTGVASVECIFTNLDFPDDPPFTMDIPLVYYGHGDAEFAKVYNFQGHPWQTFCDGLIDGDSVIGAFGLVNFHVDVQAYLPMVTVPFEFLLGLPPSPDYIDAYPPPEQEPGGSIYLPTLLRILSNPGYGR